MNDQLKESIMCYIEQFGYDIIIGPMKGIDFLTILRLKEIENG